MKTAALMAATMTLACATVRAETFSFELRTREIPIVQNAPVKQSLIEGDNFRFELAIDPTTRQWQYADAADQRTLSQRLGLTYRQDLAEIFTLSYETGAGFVRDDTIVLEEADPLTRESAVFTQKAIWRCIR